MKLLNFKITDQDLAILEEAAKLTYNKEKHRKNYSAGSFARESALNRAKRIIAKASK